MLLLAACGGKGADQGRKTPSGLPVPRYVSLKFDEVNARGGPGDDYRLLWVYRTKGLPVQVVAETTDWRRICDPTGGLAWVKATGVDGRRTALRALPQPLPLHKTPAIGGKIEAILAGRSIAQLKTCKGGWCELKTSGGSAWAPAGELWGTDERQQCR
jgi:SH3-like domain-containing protein